MARVSIVIPCFNAGAHLEEAVQSALAQTHPDTEVIVVDDGSTDASTIRLLDRSNWPRTRVIRQQNLGPAAARNRAIGAATGEYILPLDADDRIHPDYAKRAVEVIEADPTIGIVYCKAMKFGVECGPWQLPTYSLQALVIDNVIFCSALFRKKDWQAVGGYRESMRHGMEDYEFWIRMVAHGCGVHQIDAYLFFYRTHEVSRTSRFLETQETVIRTYAEIYRANREFFARHAYVLFAHRLGLLEEVRQMRLAQGRMRRALAAVPGLRATYRWLRSTTNRVRSHVTMRRSLHRP